MALLKNKKFWLLAAVVLVIAAVIIAVILSGKNPQAPAAPTDPLATDSSTHHTGEPSQQQTDPSTQPIETVPPAVWQTTPQMDATYEQWLAAAMFLVMPLEYPDFQLEGIYAASNTELEQKASSQGVYFCFLSGGEQVWIHSAPLAGNRSEKGTTDLHTAQLGYASFDRVENVDVSAMTELTVADLAEPMTYTILPGLTVN